MRVKDYVFYGCLSLILIGMFLIIEHNSPQPKTVLISVETTYSKLYDDQTPLTVPIYISAHAHEMLSETYINHIQLIDEDAGFELLIDGYHISYGHQETYVNEVFQQVLFHMEMPYFGRDLTMLNAELIIDMTDGKTHRMPIGQLHLVHRIEGMVNRLDVKSQYGIKQTGDTLSRLHEVHLHVYEQPQGINRMDIGGIEVSYLLDGMILKLSIPYDDSLLYDVPIRIYYDDGHIDHIDNFIYIIDYEILKESGPLLYVLTLD